MLGYGSIDFRDPKKCISTLIKHTINTNSIVNSIIEGSPDEFVIQNIEELYNQKLSKKPFPTKELSKLIPKTIGSNSWRVYKKIWVLLNLMRFFDQVEINKNDKHYLGFKTNLINIYSNIMFDDIQKFLINVRGNQFKESELIKKVDRFNDFIIGYAFLGEGQLESGSLLTREEQKLYLQKLFAISKEIFYFQKEISMGGHENYFLKLYQDLLKKFESFSLDSFVRIQQDNLTLSLEQPFPCESNLQKVLVVANKYLKIVNFGLTENGKIVNKIDNLPKSSSSKYLLQLSSLLYSAPCFQLNSKNRKNQYTKIQNLREFSKKFFLLKDKLCLRQKKYQYLVIFLKSSFLQLERSINKQINHPLYTLKSLQVIHIKGIERSFHNEENWDSQKAFLSKPDLRLPNDKTRNKAVNLLLTSLSRPEYTYRSDETNIKIRNSSNESMRLIYKFYKKNFVDALKDNSLSHEQFNKNVLVSNRVMDIFYTHFDTKTSDFPSKYFFNFAYFLFSSLNILSLQAVSFINHYNGNTTLELEDFFMHYTNIIRCWNEFIKKKQIPDFILNTDILNLKLTIQRVNLNMVFLMINHGIIDPMYCSNHPLVKKVTEISYFEKELRGVNASVKNELTRVFAQNCQKLHCLTNWVGYTPFEEKNNLGFYLQCGFIIHGARWKVNGLGTQSEVRQSCRHLVPMSSKSPFFQRIQAFESFWNQIKTPQMPLKTDLMDLTLRWIGFFKKDNLFVSGLLAKELTSSLNIMKKPASEKSSHKHRDRVNQTHSRKKVSSNRTRFINKRLEEVKCQIDLLKENNQIKMDTLLQYEMYSQEKERTISDLKISNADLQFEVNKLVKKFEHLEIKNTDLVNDNHSLNLMKDQVSFELNQMKLEQRKLLEKINKLTVSNEQLKQQLKPQEVVVISNTKSLAKDFEKVRQSTFKRLSIEEKSLLLNKVGDFKFDFNLGRLITAFHNQKIKLYPAGGMVRDFILKRTASDIDLICFADLKDPTVLKLLSDNGFRQNFSFEPLFTNSSANIDICLKNPKLSLTQASQAVDYTINSLVVDTNGNILDPLKVYDDFKKGLIQPVQEETLLEDPYRIFRGLALACRLKWKIPHELLAEFKTVSRNTINLPLGRYFKGLVKLFYHQAFGEILNFLFAHKIILFNIFPFLTYVSAKDMRRPVKQFILNCLRNDNLNSSYQVSGYTYFALFLSVAIPNNNTSTNEKDFEQYFSKRIGQFSKLRNLNGSQCSQDLNPKVVQHISFRCKEYHGLYNSFSANIKSTTSPKRGNKRFQSRSKHH